MHNAPYPILFAGGSLVADVLNYYIKYGSLAFCGTRWYPRALLGICERPDKGRFCYSAYGDRDLTLGTPGMPSGHAQYMALFATFWILYMRDHGIDNPMYYIGLIMSALFVMYSRVQLSRCHTVPQVAVGGVLGVFLGWGLYWVVRRLVTEYGKRR